ncbi:uncharacterized protein LOC107834169 [Poecilia formosa]|uniref:uncharacterized protein LOC107834169 n=1 Tax=Poecilia formosa TaxID=48698 RepID=UPI0007B7BE56|nr:PREDICTED: uncharacterized protein LOC107834169 [Poecilia formosa]
MSFSSVLLVLLSLLPVVDQAATFAVNVTQSSYEAVKNHSITLEWTFTTRTQGSYRELFIYCSLLAPHRELVLYQVHEGVEFPESQDDQFSGRVQIDTDVLREGRIRLHVSRLRTEDSGLYLCHEPIHAKVGDDVTLPCHVKPPFDVNSLTIEWRFKDKKIYVHRSGAKDDETTDPNYKGRISLFYDEFEKGNISLKLTEMKTEPKTTGLILEVNIFN